MKLTSIVHDRISVTACACMIDDRCESEENGIAKMKRGFGICTYSREERGKDELDARLLGQMQVYPEQEATGRSATSRSSSPFEAVVVRDSNDASPVRTKIRTVQHIQPTPAAGNNESESELFSDVGSNDGNRRSHRDSSNTTTALSAHLVLEDDDTVEPDTTRTDNGEVDVGYDDDDDDIVVDAQVMDLSTYEKARKRKKRNVIIVLSGLAISLVLGAAILLAVLLTRASTESMPSPDPPFSDFSSSADLHRAIDAYVSAESAASSWPAQRYGFPIGTWNVSRLTDFRRAFDPYRSFDFDFERNHDADVTSFDEDLGDWDGKFQPACVCVRFHVTFLPISLPASLGQHLAVSNAVDVYGMVS